MPNRALLWGLRVVFGVASRLDRRVVPDRPEAVERILVVNTTAIGDTLLSTPAIRALRQRFPRARLVALASPDAEQVLRGSPHLDALIHHPGRVDLRYLAHLPRLLREIRREHFDLVVILHANDPDIVPLAYLSRAPHRIGWAGSRLAFLLTIPVRTRTGLHLIDERLGNLRALGVSGSGEMELHLHEEEEPRVDRFLAEQGWQGEPLVGVHPFGGKPYKWWPGEAVVALGDRLQAEGRRAVLLGGRREMAPARAIVAGMRQPPLVAAGVLSVRESAALIRRLQCLVSTDSGLMHVAQALGTPLVALFGPTDPAQVGPRRPPAITLRHPSGRTEAITVEEVLGAVAMLESDRSGAGVGRAMAASPTCP
ncbi:MAG: glycosyltransferase family 9 protein [Deltaproteobacteria bacterium]|nr:glycosyltransferase family 9 protein [Deltaproteobacteria bacterium]